MPSPVPAEAVVADDLSLAYGRGGEANRAVDGVSFELAAGASLAVVGDAGSGKSTLGRAVAGQLRTASAGELGASGRPPRIVGGSLRVLGTEVRGAGRRDRSALTLRVGHLPQDAGALLAPHLTIGQNVADPIYTRRPDFDRVEAGAAVARLIDAVRLPLSTMTRFPHELSRGQRQRVAIAKALILEPTLLVADDPTLGVDVLVRGRVLSVITELQAELGFALFVIGHDLEELALIADRIAVMQDGRILALGGFDEVFAAPSTGFVRELAASRRRAAHAN